MPKSVLRQVVLLRVVLCCMRALDEPPRAMSSSRRYDGSRCAPTCFVGLRVFMSSSPGERVDRVRADYRGRCAGVRSSAVPPTGSGTLAETAQPDPIEFPVPFAIPPLRERREDIPLLTEHILREQAHRSGSAMKKMEPYAQEFLEKYSWPGNISELRNAVERACALSERSAIQPSDLPPKVTQKVDAPLDPANGEGSQKLPVGSTLDDFIRGQEKMFINETLKYNNGSREKTASMLGVSIATLYREDGAERGAADDVVGDSGVGWSLLGGRGCGRTAPVGASSSNRAMASHRTPGEVRLCVRRTWVLLFGGPGKRSVLRGSA